MCKIVAQPGVYAIVNTATSKLYVGSSTNCRKRISTHLRQLRQGKHYNAHLQASFSKYGEASFSFKILEYCDRAEVIIKEQEYIDKHIDSLYNLSTTAVSWKEGRKLSDIRKQHLRELNLGKKYQKRELIPGRERTCKECDVIFRLTRRELVAGTRCFCSRKCKNKHFEKIVASKPVVRESTKFKVGHHNKHSADTKLKIGEANKGRKPWNTGLFGSNSPKFGTKASEETRQKMSESRKGHKHSGWRLTEDTKAKMKEGQRLRRLREQNVINF